MQSRRLNNISFEDVFLFTTGPTEDISLEVFVNNKFISKLDFTDASDDFRLTTKDSYIFKKGGGEDSSEAENRDSRSDDGIEQNPYLKNCDQVMITEAKENFSILDESKKLKMQCLHLQSYTSQHIRCDSNYMNTMIEFKLKHKSFYLGSVSIQMAVIAWVMSEYPKQKLMSWGSKEVVHEMDIKWLVERLAQPTGQKLPVDPDFIGARYRLIVSKFQKQIT